MIRLHCAPCRKQVSAQAQLKQWELEWNTENSCEVYPSSAGKSALIKYNVWHGQWRKNWQAACCVFSTITCTLLGINFLLWKTLRSLKWLNTWFANHQRYKSFTSLTSILSPLFFTNSYYSSSFSFSSVLPMKENCLVQFELQTCLKIFSSKALKIGNIVGRLGGSVG